MDNNEFERYDYKHREDKYNKLCKPEFDCCTQKCNEIKSVAEEKWRESNVIGKKAKEAEQQAMLAEERAKYYKKLALEACETSNEWWDQYRCLSEEALHLMKEARMYMAKSEECLKKCQCNECKCDPCDFGNCRIGHRDKPDCDC